MESTERQPDTSLSRPCFALFCGLLLPLAGLSLWDTPRSPPVSDHRQNRGLVLTLSTLTLPTPLSTVLCAALHKPQQNWFTVPVFFGSRQRQYSPYSLQVKGSCVQLFYSILGCVLPLQEVALRQSSTFLCLLSRPYRPLLPHNVISPTTFWSSG